MGRRRKLLGAGLAALAVAALRRRRSATRVELHYADGSMVVLGSGSSAGDDLLALARRTLREAGRA